jgi:putative PD-(D/E)XK family protein DUF4420
MPAVDLLQLFQSLVLPGPATSGSELSAVPIPGIENHRLAKDANGSPCLLIRQSPQQPSSTPIKLENLLVVFDTLCVIMHPRRERESGTFTIIRCTSENPALFPHFLRILSPMVMALGSTPTRAAVRRSIAGLVELFQALTAPAKTTIQGVWAELAIIRLARDPRMMVAAWHRDPIEHFDFASGVQRIEVKSSSLRRRVHHFSLAQVTPPRGTQVLVVSLFAERSGGGRTLRRLFDDVRELLSSNVELTAHLDATFYASLGSGWEEAMREAFDWELAEESVAFFGSADVPTVAGPIPVTVSDIRFSSDLSATVPLARERLLNEGGLFGAVVPR